MSQDLQPPETHFPDDPVPLAGCLDARDAGFDIEMYPRVSELGYLFIEGVVFQFEPDYRRPRMKRPRRGTDEVFDISIRGVPCMIRITSTDAELHNSTGRTERQFLLLARDRAATQDVSGGKGLIYHYLLLIKDAGDEVGVMMRGTVLILIVPEDRLDVLEELKPQK